MKFQWMLNLYKHLPNWLHSIIGSHINLYARNSKLVNVHAVLQKFPCFHIEFKELQTDLGITSTMEKEQSVRRDQEKGISRDRNGVNYMPRLHNKVKMSLSIMCNYYALMKNLKTKCGRKTVHEKSKQMFQNAAIFYLKYRNERKLPLNKDSSMVEISTECLS